MTLRHLAVHGYRSLQDVLLPLDQLTLVTGGNGSGKSNPYRALRLIVAAARGDLVGALAREGGLPAVLWAGPERLSRAMKQGDQPVQGGARQTHARLRLGFAGDPFSYAIGLGYPGEQRTAFALDPALKGACRFLHGCQARSWPGRDTAGGGSGAPLLPVADRNGFRAPPVLHPPPAVLMAPVDQ